MFLSILISGDNIANVSAEIYLLNLNFWKKGEETMWLLKFSFTWHRQAFPMIRKIKIKKGVATCYLVLLIQGEQDTADTFKTQ